MTPECDCEMRNKQVCPHNVILFLSSFSLIFVYGMVCWSGCLMHGPSVRWSFAAAGRYSGENVDMLILLCSLFQICIPGECTGSSLQPHPITFLYQNKLMIQSIQNCRTLKFCLKDSAFVKHFFHCPGVKIIHKCFVY